MPDAKGPVLGPGVKPFLNARLLSMMVPEAPPTFRMPFPRLRSASLWKISLLSVIAPAI
jgi:hypothetical protein